MADDYLSEQDHNIGPCIPASDLDDPATWAAAGKAGRPDRVCWAPTDGKPIERGVLADLLGYPPGDMLWRSVCRADPDCRYETNVGAPEQPAAQDASSVPVPPGFWLLTVVLLALLWLAARKSS